MSFATAIEQFETTGSDEQMAEIIRLASTGLSDEEVADLAQTLAESGRSLGFDTTLGLTDIASTGGPGSLTTLLCPLLLVIQGCHVPKLSVPGRPAGSVDVMAQIDGYRISLNSSEIRHILYSCGYAHFIGANAYAPRDAELFDYRKRNDAIGIPELVISSLLSKKVAVGVKRIGLDVRVAPHGNAGGSWRKARAFVGRFSRVAKLLGIQSVAFITNARTAPQPFIGRGEALMALADLVTDHGNEWLDQHARVCFAMSRSVSETPDAAFPDRDQMQEALENHLHAQGSTLDKFFQASKAVRDKFRHKFVSTSSGFLTVDLGGLRTAIVSLQDARKTETDPFPDPAGVILERQTGTYVYKGDVLASIRCDGIPRTDALARFSDAFSVSESPGEIGGYEEIRSA